MILFITENPDLPQVLSFPEVCSKSEFYCTSVILSIIRTNDNNVSSLICCSCRMTNSAEEEFSEGKILSRNFGIKSFK